MSAIHPTCAHRQCARLKSEETLAADVIGALMHIGDLYRVCEQSATRAKPDFRSGGEVGRAAFEVKRLTSGTMQRHITDRMKYLGTEPFHAVPSLRWTWLVFIDTTSARASFAAGGMSPKLHTLIAELTLELTRLEAEGVTDGGLDARIHRLTHSWTCTAVPTSPLGTGIIISESHGSSRSTDIETDVVEFIRRWLTSDHAGNLRASLEGESGQRIAVLVADTSGPAEGMFRTLSEDEACPQTPLALPAEVDAVVLIAGGSVLDYGLTDGWRRRPREALLDGIDPDPRVER